jgi:pimeloyl-ACP methyl ester carboxylesterase
MENFRLYGKEPFRVAVIHGGPGAPGEMAPVARVLAPNGGVIEPLQTAATVDGQVTELHKVLEAHVVLPVVLIGHSWGAWLSLLLAAEFPRCVARLILVSSAPFEDRYTATIMETRLARLSLGERAEVMTLTRTLNDPAAPDINGIFARFGTIMGRADAFDPLPSDNEETRFQYAIHAAVWPEAAALRRSGRLLDYVKKLKCPVVAIHGDYDPHPAAGVNEPLTRLIKDFRFILLKQCGHTPWRERAAQDAFYHLLEKERRLAGEGS